VQENQAREREKIHIGRGVELDIHIFSCKAIFTWIFLENKEVQSAKV